MIKKQGFTLAETMMVVSITVIVSAIMFFSFSAYGSTEALSKDQANVVSVLEKARAMTLDSYNNSAYGVHFGKNSVTIFSGVSYDLSEKTNIVTDLNSNVQIDGNDVIFNRLSGQTNQAGTITLSLVSATSTQRTISVFGTGLIQPN